MAFTREPALAIWQATKCLAEIHARTDAPDVSKIIAEAELNNPAWPDVGFNPTIRDFRIGFRSGKPGGRNSVNPLIYTGQCSMKIIVATLVAFLLGAAFVSTEAEARCWWNGYNHCRYYHPRYYHHGWYYHGYYHHGYWYR